VSILDSRRGELPGFPIDAMPAATHDWIERASRGAGVTPAHVAVPLLGIASSIIGAARRVMASRSWPEPMTLWCALVGYSGSGKTPGINATKRALAQIERDRKAKIAEMQRVHESKVEAAKAARKKWKDEINNAAEGEVVSLDKYRATKAAEPPPMPIEAVDPGPFVAPRLYVSNSTIEKLAVLLQVRPQGLLLLADELAGLFLNLSRYSGGQDNEFWLEAWCGGPYRVERLNRPSVDLAHLLVGVVGGLQPDKLVRSFGSDADGMYARFLFAWPDEAKYQPLTNEVGEIEPSIINALIRLIDLPVKTDDGEFSPRSIDMTCETVGHFEQFRQFLHERKAELEGREREWTAKGPSHVLRLAGTLAYLDWAFAGGDEPQTIEVQHIESAVYLWKAYFWPHAKAALRQIGSCDKHTDTRRVLRWTAAHHKDEISVKDARREALGQRLDSADTQAVLEVLVRAGWLRPVTNKTAGRPAHRWQVNPLLVTASAESEVPR
jgi:hypothetical protein